MIDKKFRKAFSTVFIGATITLFSACIGTTQVATSEETSTMSDNQQNNVSLQVINISEDKVVIELANKTNNSIYLAYSPSEINDSKMTFVFYGLQCKENAGEEYKNYGINTHGVPILESLEKDKSVYFETNPLPKINASCKIQVLYYDDEKIVDLINNKNPYLDKLEIESVEKAKKYVWLKFEINNDNKSFIK